MTGVKVLADLLQSRPRAVGQPVCRLGRVLFLWTLAVATAVPAPPAAQRGGQTAVTRPLLAANICHVSLHLLALPHAALLHVVGDDLAHVLLGVPHALDTVATRQAIVLLLDVRTCPRRVDDDIVLRLAVEPSENEDAGVVEKRAVAEPGQVGREVPWQRRLHAVPAVAGNVVRDKVRAVAFGALILQ